MTSNRKWMALVLNGSEDDQSIPYVDSEISSTDMSSNGYMRRNDSFANKKDVHLNLLINVDPSDITVDQTASTSTSTSTPISSTPTSATVLAYTKNMNLDKVGLRRNSISMPTGINNLDLERLQEQASVASGKTTDSDIDVMSDKAESESIKFFVPGAKQKDYELDFYEDLSKRRRYPNQFRSKRRLSIAPLPALKLNDREMLGSDYDSQSVLSNQNSITSVNSIASLLKEKMQAFPQMIRKKKKETKDYKIKVFVTILFFIIMFLIGYSYITYHQKILTETYFEKAKFSEKERILRIFDTNGMKVISGNLGVGLKTENTPFNCLSEDLLDDGSICFEWTGLARLYMNYENFDVSRCYTVKWQALENNVFPTDCYDLSGDQGHWFGGGVTKDMTWSLNYANFSFAPFISGDAKVHQFGNVIKRYFINSLGVGITVNDSTPLYVSINQTTNKLCLQAKHDEFAFVNRPSQIAELSYKVCTADDMKILHKQMTQQSHWDGLTEGDIKILHSIIEEPIWKIPSKNDSASMNETSFYNYSENVISMGFMRLGHILVNEFWQENIGDFTIDKKRFPTLKNSIDVLHRRGFKVVLTIQPFISTDSPNFKDAVRKKLLIFERYSDRSIPALTRYKSSSSAGVLDITNSASIPWLFNKLNAVKKEYQIDKFYLDLGTAYNIPHYYQCKENLDNPDNYAKMFTSNFESLGFIGVSTATVVPKPPAFVALPPMNSSWDGLRNVVTAAVTYGVIGYPFILAGAIGGDYLLRNSGPKMISFYSLDSPPLPPQELYIRWMQLATFLPAMQFSHLPSEYKSDYVTEIAKELTNIRTKIVIPLLKKGLHESMDEGLPLVRPLWMLDPHDAACLSVNDEFSIGEELIVAPILEENQQTREVYLPQGVWKDGVDGSLRKGSRWIHNYRVPKDKIAYFVKMPDNTRF